MMKATNPLSIERAVARKHYTFANHSATQAETRAIMDFGAMYYSDHMIIWFGYHMYDYKLIPVGMFGKIDFFIRKTGWHVRKLVRQKEVNNAI